MMNYQRAPLVAVSRLRIACPVCDKKDNCAVSEDRRIAFCRRVQSDRPGRGGWTHILTDDRHASVTAAPPKPARPRIERAPLEHRDGIYTTLLRGHLKLKDEHRAQLRRRGLSDAEIERNGYASAPDEVRGFGIADALSAYGLEGVPGFYREFKRWRMARASGLFVPYRDAHGQIQAMQYRPDMTRGGKYIWLSSPDCSSGAPQHFARGHLLKDAREVLITEGGLKADVISFFTQAPVIGIAGVSTFQDDFGGVLRREAPRLRDVLLAYDRDIYDGKKPEVFNALERLDGVLTRSGFRVRVRTWPGEAKGFDDYLLSQSTRRAEVAA
jgi:DNA primase